MVPDFVLNTCLRLQEDRLFKPWNMAESATERFVCVCVYCPRRGGVRRISIG